MAVSTETAPNPMSVSVMKDIVMELKMESVNPNVMIVTLESVLRQDSVNVSKDIREWTINANQFVHGKNTFCI